ncbi:probable 4-coumarate--CoA ligase 1 [Rhipicephalus sanguineus]|uniref:probable 4-coumarate--CoA ligase 1 n=1 Tax=Rhipicephalus sanguineus TaxID=34632 RepID=UPI0020C2B613|nr:probable 4-coumarate--CoA ligase 1 [Rhipicephalus sanguineus]
MPVPCEDASQTARAAGATTTTANRMDAVIEDGVVRSSVQDVYIPDVDLGTFFRGCCRKYKDRIAMVDDATGETYSYRKMEDVCRRVAAGLRNLGFQTGDLAGIHSAVAADLIVAFYSTVLAGGRMVFAKGNLTQRQCQLLSAFLSSFAHTVYVTVFCDDANAEKTKAACEAVPSVKTLITIGQHEGMIRLSELKESTTGYSAAGIDPRGVLAIMYSSGTTGLPKGVMVSHRNFITQLVVSGDEGARLFVANDRMLGTAPFTHVSGLWLYSCCFTVGACVIVIAPTDPVSVLKAIERHKATVMLQFPTQAQKLVQCKCIDNLDVSSMTKVLIGGSTTPTLVAQGIIEKLKLKAFRHIFGMSETCGTVTVTPAGIDDYESVGKPVPMTHIKVVDVETREKLGPRENGEICVKGPYCCLGYLNKPEATRNLYDDDGFIQTGDVGYYTEDGKIYVVDRIKELIKCMDQQVAPAELEDLLVQHDAVKEVVVTGVPHREYGEAARAFVVLFQEDAASETLKDELAKLVADQAAFHKHLHGGIEFVTSIPKSDTGKNLRRALRDSYQKNTNKVGPF